MPGWWHEHRVQERAYQIWEREGRPPGREIEHWLRAEAEIASEEAELKEEVEHESEGVV